MTDPQLTPLKVLFITHAYPDRPGSFRGRLVYRMARGLRQRGVEVHVLTPRVYDDSPLKQTDVRGVRVRRFVYPSGNRILLSFDRIPVFRMMLFFISAFLKGFGLVRRHRYHIIHGHWILPLGPVAAALGKLFHIPTVVQAHGSDVHTYAGKNRIMQKLTCFTVRRSRKVLGVSRDLSRTLQAMCKSRADHFGYHPTFIDGKLFSPGPPEERGRMVIFAGGLLENKGILPLIEAAESFLAAAPDLHLTFLGDGPLKSSIENWIEEKGLGGRVTLAGVVPYNDMARHLRRAFVLVLPSYQEGLPSIVIEALACGTPCIATAVGEIPNIIHQGQNGLLIAPGSPEEIAAAVMKLVRNQVLYSEMKKNCRESVKPYLMQTGIDRLLDFYKEAVRF